MLYIITFIENIWHLWHHSVWIGTEWPIFLFHTHTQTWLCKVQRNMILQQKYNSLFEVSLVCDRLQTIKASEHTQTIKVWFMLSHCKNTILAKHLKCSQCI